VTVVAVLRRLCALGPLLAAMAGFVWVAFAQHDSASAVRAPDAAAVKQIYLGDCAFCHGSQAEGTKYGPSLKHSGPALTDYELSTGRMPLPQDGAEVVRRTPKYDRATMDALVAYVSSLAPGGTPIPQLDLATADRAQGGEDYRLACAACHQAAGQGGALRYGEAPALHSTPLQVAEAMRTGPGTMPVFGPEAFDDKAVSGIASYVEYLRQPSDPGGQSLWHLGPLAEGMVAFVACVLIAGALVLIGERR